MAAVVGLEPTMQESKSCALPLGYTAIFIWCKQQDSNPHSHRIVAITPTNQDLSTFLPDV